MSFFIFIFIFTINRVDPVQSKKNVEKVIEVKRETAWRRKKKYGGRKSKDRENLGFPENRVK